MTRKASLLPKSFSNLPRLLPLINNLLIGKLAGSAVMRGEKYLTKPQQYALVYNEGSSWVSNLLVMKALPNGLILSKCGISVSKRVGNAVGRNRVKRLLREILRQTKLEPGWDIIFIARLAAGRADYAALKQSVNDLLSRARLLAKENDRVCLKTD